MTSVCSVELCESRFELISRRKHFSWGVGAAHFLLWVDPCRKAGAWSIFSFWRCMSTYNLCVAYFWCSKCHCHNFSILVSLCLSVVSKILFKCLLHHRSQCLAEMMVTGVIMIMLGPYQIVLSFTHNVDIQILNHYSNAAQPFLFCMAVHSVQTQYFSTAACKLRLHSYI